MSGLVTKVAGAYGGNISRMTQLGLLSQFPRVVRRPGARKFSAIMLNTVRW